MLAMTEKGKRNVKHLFVADIKITASKITNHYSTQRLRVPNCRTVILFRLTRCRQRSFSYKKKKSHFILLKELPNYFIAEKSFHSSDSKHALA